MLMALAYMDITPRRRLKILINPAGGPGRARKAFQTSVEPILKAAKCSLDVTYTTHRHHATEVCASLPLEYDAIIALSGDGLPHEIFNGLAQRPDATEALAIPVVPVPTGSANGFFLNLLGVKDGFDLALASLNIIKGRKMNIDLCSITQNDKRSFSFFTQCVGLLAELDLGTEGWRWMGDTRFVVGFIRSAIANKPCPVKVSMRIVASDKKQMVADMKALRKAPPTWTSVPSSRPLSDNDPDTRFPPEPRSTAFPPDRFDEHDEEDWWTFDKSLCCVYAGTMPYMGRDLLSHPCAQPSDGLMDVVIQETTSRGKLLSMLDGADKGRPFWLDQTHYFKVSAYRVSPLNPSDTGYVSIDGEAYPFAPFQVEAHPGIAATLSLYGRYISEFEA
ncbi:hypothetical protein BOTBODRAFT_134730 [Botryobasidium botryosum FD-172 SS1]|uniref:DAGKc domain-containing protein n=1 Tax=Botryobasidium botryosum (strain FD-172 SS1) TaxID=930990 RepID=A0A067M9J1_BOTB1|nr:hypothetical protein BOTBODRAFT_134730 [Botryobasidium botryosum FD-172 SS1]